MVRHHNSHIRDSPARPTDMQSMFPLAPHIPFRFTGETIVLSRCCLDLGQIAMDLIPCDGFDGAIVTTILVGTGVASHDCLLCLCDFRSANQKWLDPDFCNGLLGCQAILGATQVATARNRKQFRTVRTVLMIELGEAASACEAGAALTEEAVTSASATSNLRQCHQNADR